MIVLISMCERVRVYVHTSTHDVNILAFENSGLHGIRYYYYLCVGLFIVLPMCKEHGFLSAFYFF